MMASDQILGIATQVVDGERLAEGANLKAPFQGELNARI